ncbi:amino acid permease, partial [Mycoplasmopsis bovis]|uniref:amino acid permease n=1 Tax=Mycoplasmopsis bovis TaxID=28903 RepID=UPI003D2B259F
MATGKGVASEVSLLVTKNHSYIEFIKQGKGIEHFNHIGAGLGMFLAIASIFYAYDGFYVSAGIQSEMKALKTVPLVSFLVLSFLT